MFGVKKLGGFFLGHDVDTEIMDLKLSFMILLTKPVRGSGRLKKSIAITAVSGSPPSTEALPVRFAFVHLKYRLFDDALFPFFSVVQLPDL